MHINTVIFDTILEESKKGNRFYISNWILIGNATLK